MDEDLFAVFEDDSDTKNTKNVKSEKRKRHNDVAAKTNTSNTQKLDLFLGANSLCLGTVVFVLQLFDASFF